MRVMTNYFSVSKQPISSIITIMFIFGVDLRTPLKSKNKIINFRYIYQKFVSVIWIFILAHIITTFVQSDIISDEGAKGIIARKLTDTSAFVVWIILVTRRKILTNTIRQMFYLPNIKFKTRLMSLITIALIYIVPIFGWLCMVVQIKDCTCMRLVKYFSFQTLTVPESHNCLVLHPIFLIYNIIILTLRTAFTALYTLLCCKLKYVICNHTKSVTKILNCKNNRHCLGDIQRSFETYDAAIKTLKSMEKSMSLPIFLVQICDLINLFWGFIMFDPLGQRLNHQEEYNFRTAMVFVILRALVSFLCVSLAASSVNEADKEAKEVHEETLKMVLYGGEIKEDLKNIYAFRVLNRSQPFVLSAGGFFYFTNSFVLSAIGSVLTYSLLLLQINFN